MVHLPGFLTKPLNMHNVHRMTDVNVVDYALGAALFIKKKLFEEIGELDEAFFFYGEETDFCLRARRAGYKTVYYPGYRIMHFRGGSSSDGPSYFSTYHRYKSKYYYLKKNHSYSIYRLFWLRKVLQLSIRILFETLIARTESAKFHRRIISAHFKEF